MVPPWPQGDSEGEREPVASSSTLVWVKGCCLPLWRLAGIEASFPSHSTKGPRGPWLDTGGPALGSNPGGTSW